MNNHCYVVCAATVVLATCHVSDESPTIELGPAFVGTMTAGVN